MIKNEKIKGKDVIVAYFNAKMQPCEEKDAVKIEVRYPDGRVVLASLAKQPPGK